jgi:hypothetical protein
MKRLARDQEKKLHDDAQLAKAWCKWHAEELAEARKGPHDLMFAAPPGAHPGLNRMK